MQTCITRDIKVSVEVFYQPFQSQPNAERFIFSYRIHIENLGRETVQLQRRHWFISDSDGAHREAEGPGVVGQTPMLQPGESHSYESWCPLRTEIGKMGGFFTMMNLKTKQTFAVKVPYFNMIAPFKEN